MAEAVYGGKCIVCGETDKTSVERGSLGDNVTSVAELHRALEALQTYNRGRGVVLEAS